MGQDLEELAGACVPRGRRAGIALAFVAPDGTTETVVRPGRIPFADDALFELGSVGKTFTATLLALLVLDGTLTLDTTVGDVLGADAGRAADVTMRELATHTAGLPRVLGPPFEGLQHSRDPYRGYGPRKLVRDLATVELTGRGRSSYSNSGFDLLGHCLATTAGGELGRLLEDRVLRPAGMATARCQPCPSTGLAKARGSLLLGGPRWSAELAGSGGVDGSIADLTAWLRANLFPDTTPLADAVRLAHEPICDIGEELRIGLAWQTSKKRPVTGHTGGTGRYVTYLAFHPLVGGIAAIENQGPSPFGPDRTKQGLVNAWFRDLVRSAE